MGGRQIWFVLCLWWRIVDTIVDSRAEDLVYRWFIVSYIGVGSTCMVHPFLDGGGGRAGAICCIVVYDIWYQIIRFGPDTHVLFSDILHTCHTKVSGHVCLFANTNDHNIFIRIFMLSDPT